MIYIMHQCLFPLWKEWEWRHNIWQIVLDYIRPWWAGFTRTVYRVSLSLWLQAPTAAGLERLFVLLASTLSKKGAGGLFLIFNIQFVSVWGQFLLHNALSFSTCSSTKKWDGRAAETATASFICRMEESCFRRELQLIWRWKSQCTKCSGSSP